MHSRLISLAIVVGISVTIMVLLLSPATLFVGNALQVRGSSIYQYSQIETTGHCRSHQREDLLSSTKAAEELDPRPRGWPRRSGDSGPGQTRLASFINCQRADVADERICHFENICWDRELSKFTFFSDPHAPDEVVVHNTGVAKLSSSFVLDHFVRITKIDPTRQHFLPLTFQKAYIPIEQADWHSPLVHVAFLSYWAENFGHALGDDIMPAYSMMKAFDLITADVQLVSMGPCCDRLRYSKDAYDRGVRNLHTLTKLISHHSLIETNTDPLFSKNTHKSGNVSATKRYTCLRNLLAGHGSLGIRFDRDFAWSSFIDAAICRAKNIWPESWDALSQPNPRNHLILVLRKDGRRRILNYDALVTGLKNHFSVQGTSHFSLGKVDVMSVEPASLSLGEQIALCNMADLVISPCGGISFFASFLPRGKAAIFVGYWDTNSNRSENMEGFLWRYVTRQSTFFYDVTRDDITILPPGNATRAEWTDYRDYGAVKVDVEKMAVLAKQALLTVTKGMGNNS